MKDDPPDASLLIGLHKLAEQSGDGLVPELYSLLMRRTEGGEAGAPDTANVVPLPARSRSAALSAPATDAVLLRFDRRQ